MRKRNTWVAYKSHIDNFDWLKKILYMNKTLPKKIQKKMRPIDRWTNQPANQPTESIFEYLNNHKSNDVAHSKSSGTWDGPTTTDDEVETPRSPNTQLWFRVRIRICIWIWIWIRIWMWISIQVQIQTPSSAATESMMSFFLNIYFLFFIFFLVFKPHCQGAKELQLERFP